VVAGSDMAASIDTERSAPPRTPDFVRHGWHPLTSAELTHDGFVTLTWDDGTTFDAYSLWLAENADGYGLEPVVRESTLDPRRLPGPQQLVNARVDGDGALVLDWDDRQGVRVHPGWLRHVADDHHLPGAALPAPRAWTASDHPDPPTVDGSRLVDDDPAAAESALDQWLHHLVESGLCRLTGTPTDPDFLGRLMQRVGPIRDTNFGAVWSVQSRVDPDSTAYTGLELGQHSDLPTREVPPGFQFLHCIENTVEGGRSRMTDGLSLVAAIADEHPDAYEALTGFDWVFLNRSTEAEHRWIGPIIDLGSRHQPLTLRAFYPVRIAPRVPRSDVARAYDSLRVFADLAHDPRFMIEFPFRPGDLVGFDNRRVLHGRGSFDTAGGSRHLRGCYVDHDDLYSRLRVLRRNA
jgi:gamma-butyrobetaine dioxygenase